MTGASVRAEPRAVPVATAAAVPAIRVRHLWHRYGNLVVLRDVSFEVNQGEIFGFIGPNGAGKTTTIRLMATLLEPMAGRVEIDGVDVAVDPDRVRTIIGYMPDHAGVYERITVREYLEFFADAYGVLNIGVVDAVIELTELGKLQDRLVATLSKGMKQRLQLARILLHDPKVLILDEPASDLDPRARIEIRDLLLELRELGKTIFLSSHILTELSDVCSSVGILERGQLLVAGPIGEIADRLQARHAQAKEQAGRQPTAPGPPRPAEPSAAEEPVPTAVRMVQAEGNQVRPAAPAPRAPAQPAMPPAAASAVGPAAASVGREPPPAVTAGGAVIPGAARKRLRLRVLGDSRSVAALIVGGTGVLSVDPGPAGQLAVHYTGDEVFIAELVRHLVAHGIGVVGVEPERNELERIFLEVTRGELQ